MDEEHRRIRRILELESALEEIVKLIYNSQNTLAVNLDRIKLTAQATLNNRITDWDEPS